MSILADMARDNEASEPGSGSRQPQLGPCLPSANERVGALQSGVHDFARPICGDFELKRYGHRRFKLSRALSRSLRVARYSGRNSDAGFIPA
jgi:hypothetical protein